MAAPSAITIDNLSGEYVLDKSLSDSTEPLFELQGIPWVVRKAMKLGTPTLLIKQYADEKGTVHIDVNLTAAAGIKGSDDRVLDWSPIHKKDGMFGEVTGQSRFTTKVELAGTGDAEDLKFLSGQVLADGTTHSSWVEDASGNHVQNFVKSDVGGWTAEQVWGFEEIGGVRYHTRRLVVRKDDTSRRARQVYSYTPSQ